MNLPLNSSNLLVQNNGEEVFHDLTRAMDFVEQQQFLITPYVRLVPCTELVHLTWAKHCFIPRSAWVVILDLPDIECDFSDYEMEHGGRF